MLPMSARRLPLALALLLLPAPGLGQQVQLDFGIQGTALRSFYEPGVEELERGVRDRLLAHCREDPHLRYWPLVATSEGEASPSNLPALDVTMLLQDDVLRVQLDVRSVYLSELSEIATTFSERLVPPGQLELITTRGAPPANQLAGLVEASFDLLLANNLAGVFASIMRGCPLGSLPKELAPQVDEEGQRFELVLPIDVADERNCFLQTSTFELLCESRRSTDTRLESRGTGFGSEYPPLPSVPPEERFQGLRVALERLRIGTGAAEPLATETHAELMRSVKPHLFFLRELNEGAHTCFGDEISLVP